MFRNETKEWYHVRVNGEEIVCTGGHPFFVVSLQEFRPARELKVGTKLLLSSGECATIEAVQVERLEAPETTYNFEVADYHTYFVSECSVLVHNNCSNAEWAKERKRYWKEQGEKYKDSIDEKSFSESRKYKLNKGNIERMQQGKAPKGLDGKSVNLHHTFGREGKLFNVYEELTRTEHYAHFKELHPWLYKK